MASRLTPWMEPRPALGERRPFPPERPKPFNTKTAALSDARPRPEPRTTRETARPREQAPRSVPSRRPVARTQEQAVLRPVAPEERVKAAEKRRQEEGPGPAPKVDPLQHPTYQRLAQAWSRAAGTQALTDEQWAQLTDEQKQSVQLNADMVSARDADKAAGGTDNVSSLRDALGLKEGDASTDSLSALVGATRLTDLFGPDGATKAVGEKPKQQGVSLQSSIAQKISKGLDAYFSKGRTGAAEGGERGQQLDAVLGATRAQPGSDETFDAVLRNASSREMWDSGATYEQLVAELTGAGYDPDSFWQYAGARLAEAEQTGEAFGDMTPAEVRAVLGLVTE